MIKRLSFTIVSIMLLCSSNLWAQERTISGNVFDSNGETLPGVSILIKGTTTGTISSFDGTYKLNINSAEDVLVYRFVGFQPQEITVGTQSVIDVTLQEDAEQLEEVEIVGYTKKDVSSSTPEIKNVQEVTTPSLAQSMQGKATGVQVNASSGQPGAKSNIVIRGVGSLSTSSDPLYVVDGIIMNSSDAVGASQQAQRDPLSSINPADIKDIKILKDAAATAQYGARAANGVILVTTKQGEAGKTKISFNTKAGVTQLNEGNMEMMNGDQFRDFHRNNPDFAPGGTANTDWMDEAFRSGTTQTYELSASGGNEKTRFYTSGGYYGQEGILEGSEFNRLSGRLNLDHDVNDWLTFSVKTNIAHVDQLDASDGNLYSSPLLGAQLNDPTVSPYDEFGNPRSYLDNNAIGANFVHDVYMNERRTESTTGNISTAFNVYITDWLTFRQTNSMSGDYTRYSYYTSPTSYDGRSENGSKENNYVNTMNFMNTSLFSFEKSWDKHNVSGVAGYEYNHIGEEGLYARGVNMPVGLENLNSAASPSSVGGYYSDVKFNSIITSASYNYDGKYYLSGSYRRDGSSRFGEANKYGNFWSVAGSWFVSREDFMADSDITELKLRTSYGTTGNANISNFESNALYGYGGYGGTPAAYYSQLGNPDLTWEKRKKFDLGLDASYKDRLHVNFDYYMENSEDLLLNQQVSGTTGFETVRTNLGVVKNSGIEIAVAWDVIKKKDFNWTTSFNLTTNNSEIIDLGGQELNMYGDKITMKEGSELYTWTLREWAGAHPETGAPSWYVNDADKVAANPENYYQMSDGRYITDTYSDASTVECGSSIPDGIGGWSNTISYKGFDLSVFFTYSYGGKIYNGTKRYAEGSDGDWPYNMSVAAYEAQRWTTPGQEGLAPAVGDDYYGGSNHSTRFLESGNYFSLRNVTLGYTLPKKIAKKLHTSNLRIYASGDNLWTYSKDYSGYTPTTVAPDGYNFFEYPEGRSFMMGLTIDF